MKNNFYQKSFTTVNNLTASDVSLVFRRANAMKHLVEKKGGDNRLKRKMLAALFFEPSTRTFSSFITAMQRLGGGIIPLNGMNNTSISKGETLPDTARVFSQYADVLVIRHPEPGSVQIAAENATIPVINGGDGVGEHPTQALIDSYTIFQTFGKLDSLHILMIGDLAHYRPTNSLSKLLALYPFIKLSFATPSQVPLPADVRKYLKDRNVKFTEYTQFTALLPDIDVLYVTRVKREYMSDQLYQQIKGSYVVDKKIASKMKKKSIIMHCLPRIDEIAREVDEDHRSIYMNRQIRNGLYVRMALLDLILRK